MRHCAPMMHSALQIITVAAICRHRRARAERSPVLKRILSALVFRSARAEGPKVPSGKNNERPGERAVLHGIYGNFSLFNFFNSIIN